MENTGWAVVDKDSEGELKLVECGVILTRVGTEMPRRLEKIYNDLEEIIKKHRVEAMAIESLFFAKNAKSALKVAEAIGVVKLCGRKNKLEVVDYTPLQIKMALAGYGRAEKEQVETMVRSCLGLTEPISPSHASDAVAAALTHEFTMKV